MKRLLLNDKFILTLVLLNAFILFLNGFELSSTGLVNLLLTTDHIISGIFVIEIAYKIHYLTASTFFKSTWNKFDFIIISISFISVVLLLLPFDTLDFSFLLIFRVFRVFKVFRFIRFIPNINVLILGVIRALKASVIILLSLIIYNFVLAILSYSLFKEILPDYFSNPLISLYSIFKIFTIEGWFEIPELIAQNTSQIIGTLSILYFILILISGGILGLSLVNSIFVDAMVADNNDSLEAKVDVLAKKIDILTNSINKPNIKS